MLEHRERDEEAGDDEEHVDAAGDRAHPDVVDRHEKGSDCAQTFDFSPTLGRCGRLSHSECGHQFLTEPRDYR